MSKMKIKSKQRGGSFISQLNKDYSPSSCLKHKDDLDVILQRYRTVSNSTKEKYTCQTLYYGRKVEQTINYFPATRGIRTPLHIFIHGGYWQQLSKDDSCFIAPACVENGAAFAAINYTLAPQACLAEINDECAAALIYLVENAEILGFDPDRISISGSSAGAHLCAELLMIDWTRFKTPSFRIENALLISGIYDLRPLVQTYVNDALKMDKSEAILNSPQFKDLTVRPHITIVWGEIETKAFKKQSELFANKIMKEGCTVQVFEVPQRNHFDIVFDLCDQNTLLGKYLKKTIAL